MMISSLSNHYDKVKGQSSISVNSQYWSTVKLGQTSNFNVGHTSMLVKVKGQCWSNLVKRHCRRRSNLSDGQTSLLVKLGQTLPSPTVKLGHLVKLGKKKVRCPNRRSNFFAKPITLARKLCF